MAGETKRRNPVEDRLITKENSVVAFIDYQPTQVAMINSHDKDELVKNILVLGKVIKEFDLDYVLSTVAVQAGRDDTLAELKDILNDAKTIDRMTMNSWEDEDFKEAIIKTGKKKLILAGLWTEVCVAFPAIDALAEGYDVYFVEDAIGGVSKASHEAGVKRMIQAGAKPISIMSLACELQRDWAREGANHLRNIFKAYMN